MTESIDADTPTRSSEQMQGCPSRPPRRARSRVWFVAVATALALTLVVASASAASEIEGVWSFNGGQIAVQPEGNGSFEGVVVQPTQFANCVHPLGQKIWKAITLQADGSYWGLHQWYQTASCLEDPTLGRTAWRVIDAANGSRYLRICLSNPESAQPTLPPGSSGIGASYGCQSSALTAPLAASMVQISVAAVSLPSSKRCVSLRRFAIHIQDPKYDPFKSVVVTLRSRRVAVTHRGKTYIAIIDLKGLPSGHFTVKIKAVTFRGHHVSGARTYNTCAKKPKRATKKPKK